MGIILKLSETRQQIIKYWLSIYWGREFKNIPGDFVHIIPGLMRRSVQRRCHVKLAEICPAGYRAISFLSGDEIG